jgi:hypothetical protein
MPSIRKFLYNSGDLFLPREMNRFLNMYIIGNPETALYIKNWSLFHVFSGIIIGYFVNKYLIIRNPPIDKIILNNFYFKMLMFHTVFEIWQIFIENSNPFVFKGHGNFIDIIVDTILFMIGAFIFKQFN